VDGNIAFEPPFFFNLVPNSFGVQVLEELEVPFSDYYLKNVH